MLLLRLSGLPRCVRLGRVIFWVKPQQAPSHTRTAVSFTQRHPVTYAHAQSCPKRPSHACAQSHRLPCSRVARRAHPTPQSRIHLELFYFTQVWKAQHRSTGQTCAIKLCVDPQGEINCKEPFLHAPLSCTFNYVKHRTHCHGISGILILNVL